MVCSSFIQNQEIGAQCTKFYVRFEMGIDLFQCDGCTRTYMSDDGWSCGDYWKVRCENTYKRAFCTACMNQQRENYQSKWCTRCEVLSRDYYEERGCVCCGKVDKYVVSDKWLECEKCQNPIPRCKTFRPKNVRDLSAEDILAYVPEDIRKEAETKALEAKNEKKRKKIEAHNKIAQQFEEGEPIHCPHGRTKRKRGLDDDDKDQLESSTAE